MPTCVINSNPFRFAVLLTSIFLLTSSLNPAQVKRQRQAERNEPGREDKRDQDDEQERRVDDPSDEDELNRGLWEFARGTPYDQILPYVAEAQRKSRANQVAEVELPNGWRL